MSTMSGAAGPSDEREELEILTRPGELKRAADLADNVSLFFWVCIMISSLSSFICGFSLGFSSPTTVAAYQSNDGAACVFLNGTRNEKNSHMLNCDLRLSDEMTSWFGSIINVGCLIGALCGGQVADVLGKKMGMVAAFFFYAVGWLLCCLAPSQVPAAAPDNSTAESTVQGVDNGGTNGATDDAEVVWLLLLSRILVGVALGLVCTSVSSYQTELAPTRIRGAIGTAFQVSIVVGLLAAYVLGSLLDSWRNLAYIMLATSLGGLTLAPILPESPVWLLSNSNKRGLARKNLLLMRAADSVEACDLFLHEAEDAAEQERVEGGAGAHTDGRGTCCGGLCARGPVRKALVIGVGLMFAQQWSGINAVMFYCGNILESIFGDPRTANALAIGVQGMQLIVTIASAFFMDRAGRKPLLITAALGQGASAILLAAYYLTETCTDSGRTGGAQSCASTVFGPMVSVGALYGYVFFYACGMGAIPWFLMGEIFPAPVKGFATAICTAINWILSFSVTKTVTLLATWFGGAPHGMGWVFCCYGSMSLLTAVFVALHVPETKGKSFHEIQRLLTPATTPRRRTPELGAAAAAFFPRLFDWSAPADGGVGAGWGCMSLDVEDSQHSMSTHSAAREGEGGVRGEAEEVDAEGGGGGGEGVEDGRRGLPVRGDGERGDFGEAARERLEDSRHSLSLQTPSSAHTLMSITNDRLADAEQQRGPTR
jgi:SP family sugar porter-like MFS transporter